MSRQWTDIGSWLDEQEQAAEAGEVPPGKVTLTSALVGKARAPVQARAAGEERAVGEEEVQAVAEHGVGGASGRLPFADAIASAFGRHDVSDVRVAIGGEAGAASRAIGAEAYATGDRIGFARQPDLHLAAHEAAHVVQQRGGVQLAGGVGRAGDAYERHADEVADRVARGESAEALLDAVPGGAGGVQRRAVQRFGDHESDTMAAHRGMAEDFRRWTGEDLPESEITHGGAAMRPALPRDQASQRLIDFTLTARVTRGSVVPASFVQNTLANRAQPQFADVNTLFDTIVTEAGTESFMLQMGALERRAPDLLHVVENHFIRDPGISGLDVLGAGAAQYTGASWGTNDYPGNGGDSSLADRMHADMRAVVPERRANSGPDAVVTRDQFNSDAAIRTYISGHLQAIPAFTAAPAGQTAIPVQPPGKQLLVQAATAFLAMRDAALADGVPLVINDAFRSAAVAAANAAASGNPAAVASYSSHSLGLAVDLNMSVGAQHFAEDTTTPMQNVVDMRTSPVHRWMLVRAASHGWFPYTPEPWHWEYNPPGFRQQLMDEIHAPPGAVPTGPTP